jgi:hypothetical protein
MPDRSWSCFLESGEAPAPSSRCDYSVTPDLEKASAQTQDNPFVVYNKDIRHHAIIAGPFGSAIGKAFFSLRFE